MSRFLVCLLFLAAPLHADEVDTLLRDIKAVSKDAIGSTKARSAWEKLVELGPEVLPRVLEAMDTPNTVTVNWLRTAFERIVETAEKKADKHLDAAPLLKFAADRRRQGRARRLALDEAERLKPGSREQVIRGALDDPEFRYEAIDLRLKDLATSKDAAAFREAFTASRDLEQSRRIAAKLKELKVDVSVADHMGFLRQWYVIGPFDSEKGMGFKTEYPPEKKVDLQETFDGKDGKKLVWKKHSVEETTSGRHAALVDLRKPLGDAEDAVAFAWTTIKVEKASEVEFRGSADDNFTVWVNGERVFGFEEYRNGVRLDRHRFKVRLKAGANTVLVKICQASLDETNRDPNWEFMLRICDATGKGIDFKPALP
jgi:hypothetical protein